MTKNSNTVNNDKDKSANVKPGEDAGYNKANEVPTISDDKFGYKPKYNPETHGADPWAGKGGAFTIDDHGFRVPLEVPNEPNRPMPPDAYEAPKPATDEAPQDKTTK